MSIVDPATEKAFEKVASATVEDALAAADAAYAAGPAWARTAPRERAEILRRSFDLVIENRETMARLMVRENGKCLRDALAEVDYAAEFFRWFAEEAVRNSGEVSRAPRSDNRIVVLHQPIGMSVLVTPWNFPAAMATRKIGPALAAGCTVILKPASATPLTALMVADLMAQAGAPDGVVNVIPSLHSGAVVGKLLHDPRVRKLSFTGSTEVGRTLLSQAADCVVSCSMELGGNAPFLVLDDADLDAAVSGAMIAKMRNGGEACTAANRFYVHEKVQAEFENKFVAAMKALKVGPGLDEGIDLGPLINRSTRDKVQALVDQAVSGGAKVLTGGSACEGPGFFYPPTVLSSVIPGADILREEIFGPVAPIVSFCSEDEAITSANDTEYGLVAYLYTKDLKRGMALAERLEAGMVALNRGLVSDPAAPFGGVKQSGLGREGGHDGMLEFVEKKYIALEW